MGEISAAKGVTQIDNNSAMAGPEQIMRLGDELAGLIGEEVEALADLPSAGAVLNGAKNWPGRRIFVRSIRSNRVWDASAWVDSVALGDTGWVRIGATGAPGFATGWSNYIEPAVPWTGTHYRRKGGYVTITGAAAHSGWSNLSAIFTLPEGFRPDVTTVQGEGCLVRTSGQVIASGAGTVARSLYAHFPVVS